MHVISASLMKNDSEIMEMFANSVVVQALTSTTFAVTAFCVIIALVLWRFFNDPLKHIPKPEHSFFLGHLKQLNEHPDLYVLLEKWYNKYKDIGLYRMDTKIGPERVVIINPEFARQIFVTNGSNYYRAGLVKRFFKGSGRGSGESLFISNGPEHTFQRKLLNPMFSYGTVLGFLPTFEKYALDLVNVWKNKILESEDGQIEAAIYNNLNHVALDIIGKSAFEYEFNSVTGNKSQMQEALDAVFSQRVDIKMQIYNMVFPFLKYLPTAGNKKLKESANYIKPLLNKLISKSKQSLKEEKDGENSNRKSASLLKLLLHVQEQGHTAMTDSRIRANVFSFLFAGHETTATSLMWTLLLLAQHKDIQQKGFEDVFQVLEDGEELTRDNIDKLEYIDCIIKESMRLYPAAPIVLREAHEDDTIGQYHIPKGTLVMIDLIHMQRSDELWEDAKSFKPERFFQNDSDEYKKSSVFRYFPFTAGPRSCIGRRFALMEMKVILSLLLKHFQFGIDPDHPSIGRRHLITMKASPDINLNISLR